jgi:hypothetical protein
MLDNFIGIVQINDIVWIDGISGIDIFPGFLGRGYLEHNKQQYADHSSSKECSYY